MLLNQSGKHRDNDQPKELNSGGNSKNYVVQVARRKFLASAFCAGKKGTVHDRIQKNQGVKELLDFE